MFLKLDFTNAFNTIRRDHVAECFARHAPQLLPFFNLCYEKDSLLVFGSEFTLSSSEGVQQGDPLAVFAFCLGLNDKIKHFKSRFDDVSFADHWRVVLDDLSSFKLECESIGLKLNDHKSELFFLCEDDSVTNIVQEFRSICPDICITGSENLTLLGSPIGSSSLGTCLQEKISDS